MRKKISIIIPCLAFFGVMAGTPVYAAPACTSAADCATKGLNAAGGDTSGTPTDAGVIIKNIVNILLFVIGAVSVIMIVIGGLKYVISNGDSSQVKSAKDTIFYAVIGLIIAILAYAIVNWVIAAFIPTVTKPAGSA